MLKMRRNQMSSEFPFFRDDTLSNKNPVISTVNITELRVYFFWTLISIRIRPQEKLHLEIPIQTPSVSDPDLSSGLAETAATQRSPVWVVFQQDESVTSNSYNY